MQQFELLEYLENEKSFYAEWFSSLDAAPAIACIMESMKDESFCCSVAGQSGTNRET